MAKKRRGPGRPKTTGRGTLIGVRCHKEFLAGLDKWRGLQPGAVSRPDALRQLAEIGLVNARQPARPGRGKRGRAASDMAGRTIDGLADPSVTVEDRAKRKRRLLKGPKEFRKLRDDQPKSPGRT